MVSYLILLVVREIVKIGDNFTRFKYTYFINYMNHSYNLRYNYTNDFYFLNNVIYSQNFHKV